VVEHVALSLEQNMQASVAETAAFLGDRLHTLPKAGIIRPRGLVSHGLRQQPMALHARRSPILWLSTR
jgi:hypothetical protein